MNKKLLAYLSTNIIPIYTTLKSVKRSETNQCMLITQASTSGRNQNRIGSDKSNTQDLYV